MRRGTSLQNHQADLIIALGGGKDREEIDKISKIAEELDRGSR
jgi:hypothetical protein